MAEAKKDSADGAGADAAPAKSKRPTVTLLFIILQVLGGSASVGLVYYATKMTHKHLPSEKEERIKLTEGKDTVEDLSVKLFPLETFMLNLKSSTGEDHLKMTIQLEVFDDSLTQELTAKLPIIRDAIVSHLVERRADQLDSVQEKLFLKSEIVTIVNKLLKTGSIRSVYMTQFLIQ